MVQLEPAPQFYFSKKDQNEKKNLSEKYCFREQMKIYSEYILYFRFINWSLFLLKYQIFKASPVPPPLTPTLAQLTFICQTECEVIFC